MADPVTAAAYMTIGRIAHGESGGSDGSRLHPDRRQHRMVMSRSPAGAPDVRLAGIRAHNVSARDADF